MSRPLDALTLARALAAGEILWLLTDADGQDYPELRTGTYESVQDELLAEYGLDEWPRSWRLTPVGRVSEERERAEAADREARHAHALAAELDRQLGRAVAAERRAA